MQRVRNVNFRKQPCGKPESSQNTRRTASLSSPLWYPHGHPNSMTVRLASSILVPCPELHPRSSNGPRANAGHRPIGVKSEFPQRKYTPAGPAQPVLRRDLQGLGLQRGGEVDQVVDGEALAVERRGPGGERLRGRGALARHVGLRHGPLLDGPHRLAGHAVEHIGEGLLGDLRDGLNASSVDGDVEQRGAVGGSQSHTP